MTIALTEGVCRWCGGLKEVNYLSECGPCHDRAVVWLPPDGRQLTRSPTPGSLEALNNKTEVAITRRAATRGWSMGNYYRPPPRPQPPEWRTRPWQRYRWQVEDGRRRRSQRKRTAPERLHPREGYGVWIRCLACLGMTDKLRHDQVCEACEKDWRRARKPWGEDYDYWMMNRRVRESERSGEHLAAYDRAKSFASVRPPIAEIKPLTRGTTTVLFPKWDHGCGVEQGSASSF